MTASPAPYVFIVSHNNAREGAPRLCAKLAAALHRLGGFARVYLCALHAGACPEPSFAVVDLGKLAAQVRALLRHGYSVRVLLSTVICTRAAGALRASVGEVAAGQDFAIAGLVHEVRNDTFAWVAPAHLAGLDKLAFVARYTADSYGPEFAAGTPRTVIHNWLSAGEMARMDAVPEDRTRPVVLAVGVVARHKGQLHVAHAVRRLRASFPEYKLLLVGHVYDPAYAARVKDIDPEGVEIAGPVEHAEVVRLMRSCRVFVHGSPMESCCLSVMEAMYCKCPVVAARVGGIPEEVTDGVDGLLYEFDDHETCAALLERLASSVPLREELGGAARRTVRERFLEGDKLAAYRNLLR
eukprot:jgi/Tetstr1/454199/TSEL_041118.t1